MLRLVKLEDRLVLDGAALAEALETGLAEFSEQTAEFAEVVTEQIALATPTSETNNRLQPSMDLVLVSDALDSYQQLVGAVTPGTQVMVYDAATDSAADILQRVSDVVGQGDYRLGTLSILSHGDDGALRLGNDVIDAQWITANADAWEQLQDVFLRDGQLNLFSCNLAATDAGKLLVEGIAALIGVDVSASNDVTGAGGDWELEYRSGEAIAGVDALLDLAALSNNYQSSLIAPVVTTNTGVTLSEGGSVTLTTDMLSVTDVDSTDENIVYRLETTPTSGVMRLNDQTLQEGDSFTQDDLVNGLVEYIHIGQQASLDSFDFTVTDENLGADSGVFSINITEVNDRPQIDLDTARPGRGSDAVFTENQGEVTITNIGAGGVDLRDVDSSTLSSAVVDLTNIQNAGLEVIRIDVGNTGIQETYDINTGRMTLTGVATLEQYEQVLQTLTFENFSEDPDTTQRVVNIMVNDGDLNSAVAQVLIDVIPVNDAPVINAPADQTVDEDTTLTIDGVTISDIDARGGELVVTLTTNNGTLTLNDTTGLTFDVGDGTDDPLMTLRGDLDTINAALDGLSYSPNENYHGPDNINIVVNDQGNTGGGALFAEDDIAITVNPVVDAPELDLDGPPNLETTTTIQFTEDEGETAVTPDLTLTTEVEGETISSVTVNITNLQDVGDEILGVDVSGTNITALYDPDTGELTLVGDDTSANYEAVLRTLNYNNLSQNPSQVDRTLSFEVTDSRGEIGNETATIEVTPVNDPPVWTAPDTQVGSEDESLQLPAITLGDVDAEGGDISVTLSVNNGTFTLSDTTGLQFSDGDGVGDVSVTFTGTLDEINAAVASINYTPDANFTGQDQLQLYANDLGNTGGGPLIAQDSVDIVIAGVNDPSIVDLSGPDDPGRDFNGVFTEDQGPVTIVDSDLNIIEIDVDVLQSATMTITNPIDGNVERLTVDVADTGLQANFDPNTGVLTLTGEATIATYEQVLRTLSYENLSNEPDTTDRVVSVIVNDGTGDSDPVISTVEIIPVNDPPTIQGSLIQAPAEGTINLTPGNMLASDPESGTQGLVYTVTDLPDSGQLLLNGQALSAGDTFTQEQLESGELQYENLDPLAVTDTFNVSVADSQGASSDPAAVNILIGGDRFNPDSTNDTFDTEGDIPNRRLDPVPFASELLTNPIDIDLGLMPNEFGFGSDLYESAINNLAEMAENERLHAEFEGRIHGAVPMAAPGEVLQRPSLLEVLDLDGRFAPADSSDEPIQTAQGHSIGNYIDGKPAEVSTDAAAEALGLLSGLVEDDCDDLNADPNELSDAYLNGAQEGLDNCDIEDVRLETVQENQQSEPDENPDSQPSKTHPYFQSSQQA